MSIRYPINFIRWLQALLDGGYSPDLAIDVAGGAVAKSRVYFSYYRFCSFIDHTRPAANSQFFRTLKKAIPEIREKWGNSSDRARRRELVFPPLSVARDGFELSVKQPGMIVWS